MDLRISQTGVRSGEFIAASPSGTQNKGTVIQIRGTYPPEISRVRTLDPIILRDSFNIIPFFAGMSPQQRLEWLINNGTDTPDLYLDDTDIWVKFVRIGDKNFFHKSLGIDGVNLLLQGNPNDPEGFWSIHDVYNMFPRKPGSRANKTTLIFRPSNWSLMIPERSVNTYTGVYILLNANQLASGTIQTPPGGKIYSFDLESNAKQYLAKLGIVITQSRQTPLTEEHLFRLASKYCNSENMKQIAHIINWFPPSLHKSLIQKLIRTRCEQVEYSNQYYTPSDVLLTSMILLMMNPGVFVPDIRRFVTGLESVTKRLAISIHEDSFTTKNDIMMGLYAASMIAQDDRNWMPTDEMIDRWFELAIEAQAEGRAYQYDQHNFNGVISQYDYLSLAYILLNEIRSFQSDIDMVGSIAQNGGKTKATTDNRITIMPLIHCVDHHSLTDIAHYMPYSKMTYSELFGRVWNEVVGVNPRYPKHLEYCKTIEQQPFVKEVRNAQRDLWISKMYTPRPRPNIEGVTSDFVYRLDPSWLAGLVGPIEVRLTGFTAIVVLRVDNIYEMTAVKRPQRDTKTNPELTEEEQIVAIEQARKMLKQGIRFANVPVTLPIFNNSYVRLVEEQYIITLSNNQSYAWETIVNLSYKLPIHEHTEPTVLNSLLYTGDGIDQMSPDSINYLIKTYDNSALRRLSTYLTGYKSVIELAKISRDGTGTYYQVVPEDTAVNHILAYLSVMYPAAIVSAKTGYQVKNGPLLWTIRDALNQQLVRMMTFDRNWVVPSQETRKRWEHQIDSFNQMVERNKAGKRGHLIWIKVGLGKTMITIDYLDYLIREGKMPKYCVYSLPASAIDNIVKEFSMRKIPTKVIDARQTASQDERIITPYTVCLIKHDHMRLGEMDDQLKSIAREMVFIVDEFHKTLSKTIRTSLCLELARLSYDFVGMSGTIIKDTNYDELIQWLEQIVEFEVTEKNYWVAIGALVSKKVQTRVIVDRKIIEIQMPGDIQERYYQLVPENLGGTARQIDFIGAINLCYEVVTRNIVDTTVEYVKMGEGVFVVAKDISHQQQIRDNLVMKGMDKNMIHLFDKDNQITLTPEYNGPVKVVITTKRHSEGYTLTKFRIMITSVYFSNQATREQLEGRINRIGQTSPNVLIIVYHTGILSYINEKYEKARTLSEALKGFAGEVGVDYKALQGI